MRTSHAFPVALAAVLVTACVEKQIKSFSPAHDQEILASSAELFWYSLRWNDIDGAAALLEINPRIPGTIGLTTASGPNLPLAAVALALGERLALPEPRAGVRAYRYAGLVVEEPEPR